MKSCKNIHLYRIQLRYDKNLIFHQEECTNGVTEITIPIAFEVASKGADNIGSTTRRAVRDAVSSGKILYRISRDIRELLIGDVMEEDPEENELQLWDDAGLVPSGVGYQEDA